MSKILVLLGNPDAETFSGKLADTYVSAAIEAGHEVHRLDIGTMDFDPVLHKGYKEIQALEPALTEFQDKVNWADHVVIIYPNWWTTMPAKLKGLFDRAWLPGFAFNFDKESKKLVQRLKGKSARVIIVAGSHSPFMTWWKFGDYTNEIAHGILGFAGFKCRVTAFGPSERVSDAKRDSWVKCVESLAKKAC